MSALAVNFRELVSLELPDLREEWQHYFDRKAPASMSRELLRLAVGYKMQEEMSGGLSRRTLLQLSTMKTVSGTRSLSDASNLVPAPRSGTKLIREWQGKVHEVLALDDGQFAYGGKTYRSLTMIARQITGTHQSGPRFFGLKSSASIVMAGSEAIG